MEYKENSAGIYCSLFAKQRQIAKHATYPSWYEASWRADARMSISIRLSCKVSRNACFTMFLHTGGKMDMEASMRDARARNTDVPKQRVSGEQHQLINGHPDGQHGTHKPRPLWNYIYWGVKQVTSSSAIPCLYSTVPGFVRALSFSASVLLFFDKH